MAKVLVTQYCNYADEFNLQGFAIFDSEEEWEERKQEILAIEYPYDCYFGTNESVCFENVEDVLSTLNVETITDEELDTLKRLLDINEFSLEYGIVCIPYL